MRCSGRGGPSCKGSSSRSRRHAPDRSHEEAELSARASEENTFSTGDLRVDLARRRVLLKARPVYLTPIEYRLLTALVKRAGQVLTHRELLEEVWDRLHAEQTHYLHVYVAHLRRKIEADPARPRYILTEPRVGYRLASE